MDNGHAYILGVARCCAAQLKQRASGSGHEMSLLLQPSYTSKRGSYTHKELKYLALSLGHDENLFGRIISKLGLTKDSYSDTEISSWLDSKYLDRDLDYVFNRHSCEYNTKVLKKAMYYLKHHHLTFSDLSTGRQVYEISTVHEPFQLPMDIASVSHVLQLCDKVLPPLRLQHIFHSMKRSLDTPGKIKLYEFYEILGFAEKVTTATKQMKDCELSGKLNESFYDETETEYEQLSRFLNDQYKASITKPDRKFLRSEVNVNTLEAIVSRNRSSWRKRPTQQEREEQSKVNSLMMTSSQILAQARAGYHVLTAKQGSEALTRIKKHKCKPSAYISSHQLGLY